MRVDDVSCKPFGGSFGVLYVVAICEVMDFYWWGYGTLGEWSPEARRTWRSGVESGRGGNEVKEPRRFGHLGRRRSSESVTNEMMRRKLKERVRDEAGGRRTWRSGVEREGEGNEAK
ncbi:unnamed protein product [Dovyalis caffra]|uniref:Uncharacterized protein n=1 Tax=Dovyalis caffra TaxID=77055 RepID=A0AAV1RF88_9ROSI|nr:unnamed protein product [Dovyalis caffra]